MALIVLAFYCILTNIYMYSLCNRKSDMYSKLLNSISHTVSDLFAEMFDVYIFLLAINDFNV